jgi:hypothetical protein
MAGKRANRHHARAALRGRPTGQTGPGQATTNGPDPTDLVAAPDEHVAPVADGYVAAALGGTGELHGLIALEGWPWQVVRPQILVAISHLEAALCAPRCLQPGRRGDKDKGEKYGTAAQAGRRRQSGLGSPRRATSGGPLPGGACGSRVGARGGGTWDRSWAKGWPSLRLTLAARSPRLQRLRTLVYAAAGSRQFR